MMEKNQFNWLSNLPYDLRQKKDPEMIRRWLRKKEKHARYAQWGSIVFTLGVLFYWWIAAPEMFSVIMQLLFGLFALGLSTRALHTLREEESRVEEYVEDLRKRI